MYKFSSLIAWIIVLLWYSKMTNHARIHLPYKGTANSNAYRYGSKLLSVAIFPCLCKRPKVRFLMTLLPRTH
ncbi:hypothetical protein ERO13_D08G028350v2 [Gossypium hirsutum]|nr:hypothetical protein ERO13_D08G028350v2 [Gossypium hirsutum]